MNEQNLNKDKFTLLCSNKAEIKMYAREKASPPINMSPLIVSSSIILEYYVFIGIKSMICCP